MPSVYNGSLQIIFPLYCSIQNDKAILLEILGHKKWLQFNLFSMRPTLKGQLALQISNGGLRMRMLLVYDMQRRDA